MVFYIMFCFAIASFPVFIPPSFGTSEFIVYSFAQPLLLILLLNLSADVQLNCVKNYSIGISLMYHSILLISISLSSLLTFFYVFHISLSSFWCSSGCIKCLTEV